MNRECREMMELQVPIASFGETRCDGFCLFSGEELLLTVLPGQQLGIVLLRGQLAVSRVDPDKTPSITGSPLAPVLIQTAGTYLVRARKHTIGLRVERG